MKKIKLWLDDNVSPYFLDHLFHGLVMLSWLGLVIGLPVVLALLALAALA